MKKITRRIGKAYEYYQCVSGSWWILNPQHGWLSVNEKSSRGLELALKEAQA